MARRASARRALRSLTAHSIRARRRSAILAIALAAATCVVASVLVGAVVPSAEADGTRSASTRDATGVGIVESLAYGDDPAQRIDLCTPAVDGESRAAIVLVHGGSWTRGSRVDPVWRDTCVWLAANGYVVANVDYRLAPQHPFPRAAEDVQAATAWLRDPVRLAEYGIDPTRIGAFGGSAGGTLAALLGLSGSGAADVGSRVAAVVTMSAPLDLTGADVTDEFLPVQLAYLGCTLLVDCPAAVPASPATFADASDPPFLVVHATAEIIPLAQAQSFVSTLEDVGTPVTLLPVADRLHSVGLLDQVREPILAFLDASLAAGAPVE